MRMNFQELAEEIEEITTVDGFIASCLEIKESMFFYDCDLMLAAYGASLELLSVAALFAAALKGKAELEATEALVAPRAPLLLEELAKYRLPLDIQYVADRFVQDAGSQISLRMPVYGEMVRDYASVREAADPGVDALLCQAHQSLSVSKRAEGEKISALLGRVGRKMLQGAHLRPIWLEISHPRIYFVLVGLQTLVNNFRVAPYFSFPLEEIEIERQKRRKVKGNVVSDLGVARNFRQGGSGYTDLNVVLVKDDYDSLLEHILSEGPHFDQKPDEHLLELIRLVFEIRLVNDEIDDRIVLRLLEYCAAWKVEDVSDAVLELLRDLPGEDPLSYPFRSFLQGLGGKHPGKPGKAKATADF